MYPKSSSYSANSADSLDKSLLLMQPSTLHYMTSLAHHIATQGLVHGVGSDITLKVFDKTYHLHRLILIQSSFFECMLSGPWRERRLDCVELKFDEGHISQEGFEIAIARLYGVWPKAGERDLTALATAREAEVTDHSYGKKSHGRDTATLTQDSAFGQGEHTIVASPLTPQNALSVLASGAYLGMDDLCEQCTTYIITTLSTEQILAYVFFTHNNNYYPWSDRIADACHAFLCRNGFDDSKIKCQEIFEHLPTTWLLNVLGSDAFWVPTEWDRYKFCRQIVHNRRKKSFESDLQEDSKSSEDEAAYSALFATSVIYMHMTFEQLQIIIADSDPLTDQSFVCPDIVREALWQQTEMRSLIERSGQEDGTIEAVVLDTNSPTDIDVDALDSPFQHHDLIPNQDKTISGQAKTEVLPSVPGNQAEADNIEKESRKRSLYAPFRFSVEFEDIHALQVNVQMSSGVFFYAGSLWNVYIKKLPSWQQGQTLGVYLHRSSRPQLSPPSKRPRRFVHPPSPSHRSPSIPFPMWTGWGFRGSSAEQQERHGDTAVSSNASLSQLISRSRGDHKQSRDRYAVPTTGANRHHRRQSSSRSTHVANFNNNDFLKQPAEKHALLPELCDKHLGPIGESSSCYVDNRDNTTTWFKIFAASNGPSHTITQFQSSPDDFSIMQSWGWRSSDLYSASYMCENSGSGAGIEAKFSTACTGPVDVREDEHVSNVDLDDDHSHDDQDEMQSLEPGNPLLSTNQFYIVVVVVVVIGKD
ncbi:hypothetical protein BGZ99_002844 [Dissophora globulifera]|uniref:BTB domain-containing protein n=1 Tax=Dissophora globulifera TaxID=979702 RepID=A0A9P6RRP4_9FUNG|nr:hypothetical protein BGZ99_002844 [Dissophora globulifera]